ncbi:hypothetical protein ANCCAN_27543 [Ancylostoma caninum]|uniref:Uncharacterized protein n=1 Tax=Ancylostoma caninum TaxID=29170 RepID=A0A368F3P3_ANCCA|nr:hypothetical protein ANCCAN_27543 [Ancylostoma caninum]
MYVERSKRRTRSAEVIDATQHERRIDATQQERRKIKKAPTVAPEVEKAVADFVKYTTETGVYLPPFLSQHQNRLKGVSI